MIGTDKISAFLFFLLSIYVCSESYRYGLGTFFSPKAGLFPFISGLFLGFLSFLGFFDKISLKEAFKETSKTIRQWKFKKMIYTSCALFAYALLLEILGFLVCTLLLVFFIYEIIEPKTIKVGIAIAILSTVISYFIFQIVIKAQLPRGFLGI